MENKEKVIPENLPELQEFATSLLQSNRRNEEEIAYLREQVFLLRSRLYGKKSEEYHTQSGAEQLWMFGKEERDEDGNQEAEESLTIERHSRKKPGRRPLRLPREEILHDNDEEEKVCACGADLKRIGEETHERLDYIPAKMRVLRHICLKYAYKVCEGVDGEGPTVKIAAVPLQILPKSVASESLLAHVMTAKFVDAVPFYRQEKQFLRIGIELSRSTMCGWLIQLSEACERLVELLHQEIRSGPLIQIDETTVQVFKEAGRSPHSKSYMWILREGVPNCPGVLFQYHETRASDVARDLLEDYQGIV